ncbi:MAG: Gfo/Idh/MocA family oxidoreductase [Verrucomicrobia bacterium]|nr:MAG: Gfo/Idh/MocA family oxidoreductase [Verrucomicrobiota bacterium]
MNAPMNRRSFVRHAAVATIAFPMVSRLRVLGANGRLNLAGVGVGGKGWTDITMVDGENVVGLCDVDAGHLAKAGERFPGARRFADWREMFDQIGKGIDGVTVSTPDHSHFPPAISAVKAGKHVYCQKPLTHTVWEARQLTLAARKSRVATQMGNQGMAHPALRREAELVRGGAVGKVSEVHLWTDRPGRWWPQGMVRPEGSAPVPKDLSYDLWLGVAPRRPYHPAWGHFVWRGWWDFGTGALGDMGCHLMNLLALAFELRDPVSVEAASGGLTADAGPLWSRVTWEYGAGKNHGPMKVVWYDGGKRPDPALWTGKLEQSNGVLVVGSRDTLLTSYLGEGQFKSGTKKEDFKSIPETFAKHAEWERSHYDEWIAAAKGGPKAASNFEISGPVTEAVLLGNVAVRSGRKFRWNTRSLKSDQAEANAFLTKPYTPGFRV